MNERRYSKKKKHISASVRFFMTLICIIAVIMVTVYFIGAQFRPDTAPDDMTSQSDSESAAGQPGDTGSESTAIPPELIPEDDDFVVYISFLYQSPPTTSGTGDVGSSDTEGEPQDTGEADPPESDPEESGGAAAETDPPTVTPDIPNIVVPDDHEHDWVESTCTRASYCRLCTAVGLPALGHNFGEATCTEPAVCKRCGETSGEAAGHKWSEATCTKEETCSVCGKTRGDALGHKWSEATCTEPETCQRCGKTRGDALGHKWSDATCTNPETCKRCGKTRGDVAAHTWAAATCTKPKTCTVCGRESGEELGHDWRDATCTTPETCKRCDKTRGEAAGHKWIEATTSAPSKCSVCGAAKGDRLPNPVKVAAFDYTDDEYELLAKLIYVEAGARSYDGMLAVCTVVLNRVRSSSFGSTITAVITAPGQFATGSLDRINAPDECYRAARECLAGNLYDRDILYFKAASGNQSWGSRTYCFTVGNNYFYT